MPPRDSILMVLVLASRHTVRVWLLRAVNTGKQQEGASCYSISVRTRRMDAGWALQQPTGLTPNANAFAYGEGTCGLLLHSQCTHGLLPLFLHRVRTNLIVVRTMPSVRSSRVSGGPGTMCICKRGQRQGSSVHGTGVSMCLRAVLNSTVYAAPTENY